MGQKLHCTVTWLKVIVKPTELKLNTCLITDWHQIWAPALSFPNARQAEGSVVDDGTITRVLKRGLPRPDNIKFAVEADIYEGVDSPMVMEREYFIKELSSIGAQFSYIVHSIQYILTFGACIDIDGRIPSSTATTT